MDINILKIASDTKNNKRIKNCTHSTRYKSQICGDEIEIFLTIKNNMIKDFSYQSQSCIYCNASANLATKNFKKKSKEKIIGFFKLLEQYNDKKNISFPNEWRDFNKIFNTKNFVRKECITMPIEALKKIILKMRKDKIYKSLLALIFSTITIGILTLLTYKTNFGLFLVASFGSSMVLLYGYPESPFAKPKNIFFGHLVTSAVGIIFYNYFPFPIYILIPLAVGIGVGLMILLDVTHPPAGGNPIIVILGSVSFEYLFSPILTGCLIIIVFGILLNKYVAHKKYP